jgi:hypothetical protein
MYLLKYESAGLHYIIFQFHGNAVGMFFVRYGHPVITFIYISVSWKYGRDVFRQIWTSSDYVYSERFNSSKRDH